jgi:hypothetical protein
VTPNVATGVTTFGFDAGPGQYVITQTNVSGMKLVDSLGNDYMGKPLYIYDSVLNADFTTLGDEIFVINSETELAMAEAITETIPAVVGDES